MALVESYAPCPCGSGEKYKWCCHKVESYAERSLRLQETGAIEPSIAAVEEGLRKFPDSPWLLIRKALLLIRQEKMPEAVAAIRRLLAKAPGHVGGQNFLVRALVESEGVIAAAAQFQHALAAVPPENRPPLGFTAQLLGAIFGEQGHAPAAIAHFRLGEQLQGEDLDPMLTQSWKMIERNAGFSPWLRNPYSLSTSEGLSGPTKESFDRAFAAAEQGMWSAAGDEFAVLSANGIKPAGRNLGLCRLWIADDAAAVEALRLYIEQEGPSEEAVDLEALCQLIAPPQHDEPVEHVQLTWPIRDRAALLKALAADPTIDADGTGPVDPEDPNSPQADWFALLDRRKPAEVEGLTAKDTPRVEGRICVEPTAAKLDAYDDGRLNRLSARFVERAGNSIPPAHPRTKVLETLPRSSVVLQSELWMPAGMQRAAADKLSQDEQARVILEVWPGTRLPYLGRKTPRQVAGDPRYQVALRAAICQFEFNQEFWRTEVPFQKLRDELKIGPEPDIDPATVDVETLHLGRLHRVPASQLDDARLMALFRRAAPLFAARGHGKGGPGVAGPAGRVRSRRDGPSDRVRRPFAPGPVPRRRRRGCFVAGEGSPVGQGVEERDPLGFPRPSPADEDRAARELGARARRGPGSVSRGSRGRLVRALQPRGSRPRADVPESRRPRPDAARYPEPPGRARPVRSEDHHGLGKAWRIGHQGRDLDTGRRPGRRDRGRRDLDARVGRGRGDRRQAEIDPPRTLRHAGR